MIKPILKQLLALMNDQSKLKQYIENNDIPLDVFAEFVSLFKNDSNTKPATWGSFYHECIPAYFRSKGGIKSMKAFIKEGCTNKKAFDEISSLLTLHPRFNDVYNGHITVEKMSEVDKLLYDALNKLASISQLVNLMNDQSKLKQYIENNEIPLHTFAEFVSIIKSDPNTNTAKWARLYNECIPAYFRSKGGIKSMKAFIKETSISNQTYDVILNLFHYHPRFNEVYNGHVTVEKMSEVDELLYDALNKLNSIKKTGKFINGNAVVEGIAGKWKKPAQDNSELAKQIAGKWKPSGHGM